MEIFKVYQNNTSNKLFQVLEMFQQDHDIIAEDNRCFDLLKQRGCFKNQNVKSYMRTEATTSPWNKL